MESFTVLRTLASARAEYYDASMGYKVSAMPYVYIGLDQYKQSWRSGFQGNLLFNRRLATVCQIRTLLADVTNSKLAVAIL